MLEPEISHHIVQEAGEVLFALDEVAGTKQFLLRQVQMPLDLQQFGRKHFFIKTGIDNTDIRHLQERNNIFPGRFSGTLRAQQYFCQVLGRAASMVFTKRQHHDASQKPTGNLFQTSPPQLQSPTEYKLTLGDRPNRSKIRVQFHRSGGVSQQQTPATSTGEIKQRLTHHSFVVNLEAILVAHPIEHEIKSEFAAG